MGSWSLKGLTKQIESIPENKRFNPVNSSGALLAASVSCTILPLRDSPRMLLLRKKTYIRATHCVNLMSDSSFTSVACGMPEFDVKPVHCSLKNPVNGKENLERQRKMTLCNSIKENSILIFFLAI